MKPFIKWAGGKQKFASKIVDVLGRRCNKYFEPFVGSGAVLLQMQPPKAFCSDVNAELINLYRVVKKHPMELIEEINNNFIPNHNEQFFYEIRGWDRQIVTMFADANERNRHIGHHSRGLRAPCREAPPRCFS